jgi:hypothetical protein
MPAWPTWWEWELEFSSHLFKRMADRDFNEIDVRQMLSAGSTLRQDIVTGRWVIETRHNKGCGRLLWNQIQMRTF